MNFELSDEQRLLQESVSRFLTDRYKFEHRKKFLKLKDGFDPAIWQSYADLGLLGLPFAEEDGGVGGGAEEIMIVMEAFGRALAVEPYLSTAVIGGAVLRLAASAEQRAKLVPEITAGQLRLAFAHAEAAARYEVGHVAVASSEVAGGWRLDGAKTLVLHGDSAHRLIVSARVSGNPRDDKGVGLFLVDPATAGITLRGYPTQDGMRAAEITLSGVVVPRDMLLGGKLDAMPAIRQTADEAIAALCAEAVGCMDRALSSTVEYLKTRRQFDRAIGDFQVLQHRCAEMLVEMEQARSMALYATAVSREPDVNVRARAMSAAKVRIGKTARMIGQSIVQLHGGVGMTMELDIGHYFKRLTMIEKAYGDTDYHLTRLGESGGLAA